MSWKEKLNLTRNSLRNLNRANPEATRGFGTLTKAVKESGVLDLKTKEFVALGIAVAERCESCIGLHIEALIKAGASREEVADVLGMCVQMGGGPAMMYAAKALECFDELSAE
ncbi:carboxymuconolactone decarboxylase family protein [Antarcticimicrobium sediminis]|uniref:Carboxymuconolactone decarboxylase family protein n=1 Tax=Antarcticimicrobium sediminis TaxID=2546227 RepID=A0A4R5ETD0_9RHOB|nr:carboxymuconolactone decarboxylase family protein [Antarcticimicrobium sediminis]TDE37980.1 carboxymuconolactone decarboxylase family protein [Antarcticimicrobium sediminis]